MSSDAIYRVAASLTDNACRIDYALSPSTCFFSKHAQDYYLCAPFRGFRTTEQ
jgi:hypothetical protein